MASSLSWQLDRRERHGVIGNPQDALKINGPSHRLSQSLLQLRRSGILCGWHKPEVAFGHGHLRIMSEVPKGWHIGVAL